MKITLFFCAGNLAEELGIYRVEQLNGVGWRMPLTMAAFTVGAFGMIGLPPVAGFVSKWYLGLGSAMAGDYLFLFVLMMSSLLNAAYFLPLVHAAWFKEPNPELKARFENRSSTKWEISLLLLLPTLTTAAFSLAAGLFAAAPWSPLSLAKLAIRGAYFQ
jgi:multicomponent Na+:H+ antiporter subunit D